MIILAIETSCDETAISVVECSGNFSRPKFNILSNIISSQVKIHAEWGGVVPNLAKREHIKNLPIILKKALKKAKIGQEKIDLIAVTVGPGLEPALWTGINFATDLSKVWGKPLVGVNHMEGHLLSVLLKEKSNLKSQISKIIKFPAAALLVSGGHTELVLIKDWLKYKIIGQTRDDAAGEAFDKVAKMLGLPYPGGPQIAKLADNHQSPVISNQIKLPRPMINSKDYDFSFSGLKTAVLYLLRDLGAKKSGFRRIPRYGRPKENQFLCDDLKIAICREFQQAVIDVLVSKTIKAAEQYKVKTVILGGGVAANKELRKQLKQSIKKNNALNLILPEIKFTGDNAVMIAIAAYFHALKKEKTNWKILKANGNLTL
jgi:N6-L-threonylcarbamoyladenine synthase